MSRTNHKRRGQEPNGQRITTRMTKLGGYLYYKYESGIAAAGNNWQGFPVAAAIGHRKEQRERKIMGRRLERRRLKALINEPG